MTDYTKYKNPDPRCTFHFGNWQGGYCTTYAKYHNALCKLCQYCKNRAGAKPKANVDPNKETVRIVGNSLTVNRVR